MTLSPNANWNAAIANTEQQPVYVMRIDGLAVEAIEDGMFAEWAGVGDLTHWTETYGSGGGIGEMLGTSPRGGKVVRFVQGASGGTTIAQAVTLAPSTRYRITIGSQKYPTTDPGRLLRFKLKNETTGHYLSASDTDVWTTVNSGPSFTASTGDANSEAYVEWTWEFTTESQGTSFTLSIWLTIGGGTAFLNGEMAYVSLASIRPWPGDLSTAPVLAGTGNYLTTLACLPCLDVPTGGDADIDPLTGRLTVREIDVVAVDSNGDITRLVTCDSVGSPVSTLVNRSVTLLAGYRHLAEVDYAAVFTGRIVDIVAADGLTSYKFTLAGTTRLLEGLIMEDATLDQPTTIEGNAVNVVWSILTGTFSTTDPTFPLTSVSTASATSSAPTGLNIPTALLNETLMLAQRDIWHDNDHVRIEFTNPENALSYLQTEFCRTFHAFLPLSGDGKIGARFITPAAPPTTAVPIDITDHIVAVRSWRRRLDQHINRVVIRGDYTVATGEFASTLYTIEDTANQTDTDEVVEYAVDSRWLRSDLAGERIAAELATRVLARYKPGPVEVEIDVNFSRRNVEEGDVVEVTDPSLPNVLTGGRGVISTRMFVVSVRPNFDAGTMTLRCIDTGFSARYGCISGAGVTTDYDSSTDQERAAYAYVGDTANRVGAAAEPGYTVI